MLFIEKEELFQNVDLYLSTFFNLGKLGILYTRYTYILVNSHTSLFS